MSKRIIVRADDLGFSEGVNYGIAKSCREGIIRSVGIMPNMPMAKHGYDLISDLPLCLGQHTNICTGKPLSAPEKVPSICDENGYLKAATVYREAHQRGEDFVILDEVLLEVEAQYHAFVALTGDKPHYFEGHAVPSPTFSEALKIVAEKYGCDYLHTDFNSPARFRSTTLHVSMDSMFPDYEPFESLKRAAKKDYGDGILMFVCHPGYVDEFLLHNSFITTARALEVTMLCSQEIKQWLKDNDIEVITYDDLL